MHRTEDRGEVGELFAKYASALDTENYAILDEVLTEDAVWRRVAPDGAVSMVQGRSAIRGFLPASRAPGQPRHLFTNLHILSAAENSLSARMYMTFALSAGATFEVKLSFVYTAEAVRELGGWRFRELTLVPDRDYAMEPDQASALQSVQESQ